jgi:ADP-ribose pyrophosphatase YjhB (NUDIX family)
LKVDDFPRPIATVDVALFTLHEGALCVLLARREREPYAGQLALPGGFVHVDEDADTAATAARVLARKAGVARPYLEQLYTFSGKVRDPRGWSIAVAYYALVPEARLGVLAAGGVLVHVDRLPALPFDHERIVATALYRLRGKSTYSALPAYLLPEQFTIQELHQVYEQVIGVRLDKASFRRKIEDQEIVEPVAGQRRGGAHRPAQLYRLRTDRKVEFERKI